MDYERPAQNTGEQNCDNRSGGSQYRPRRRPIARRSDNPQPRARCIDIGAIPVSLAKCPQHAGVITRHRTAMRLLAREQRPRQRLRFGFKMTIRIGGNELADRRGFILKFGGRKGGLLRRALCGGGVLDTALSASRACVSRVPVWRSLLRRRGARHLPCGGVPPPPPGTAHPALPLRESAPAQQYDQHRSFPAADALPDSPTACAAWLIWLRNGRFVPRPRPISGHGIAARGNRTIGAPAQWRPRGRWNLRVVFQFRNGDIEDGKNQIVTAELFFSREKRCEFQFAIVAVYDPRRDDGYEKCRLADAKLDLLLPLVAVGNIRPVLPNLEVSRRTAELGAQLPLDRFAQRGQRAPEGCIVVTRIAEESDERRIVPVQR